LLSRCDAGKHLNAFISFAPDQVEEAARAADERRAAGTVLGRLHGLPIPIKDSVNTKDYPTTLRPGSRSTSSSRWSARTSRGA